MKKITITTPFETVAHTIAGDMDFFTVGRRSRGNTPMVVVNDPAFPRLAFVFRKVAGGSWQLLNMLGRASIPPIIKCGGVKQPITPLQVVGIFERRYTIQWNDVSIDIEL